MLRFSDNSEPTSESGVVFLCGLVKKIFPKSVRRSIFEHFGIPEFAKTLLFVKNSAFLNEVFETAPTTLGRFGL